MLRVAFINLKIKFYLIRRKQLESQRQAFTMLELTFVIVIIGILSAVAIPKLTVTRDGAVMSKTISTVASVKSALAAERQKRILRGEFADLNKTSIGTNFANLLEYKVKDCNSTGCDGWQTGGTVTIPRYTFYGSRGTVIFRLNNNRLECDTTTLSPNNCAMYE